MNGHAPTHHNGVYSKDDATLAASQGEAAKLALQMKQEAEESAERETWGIVVRPETETVLLSTYKPPPTTVLLGLEVMRKACVEPNRVEVEQARLENSMKGQLIKLKHEHAEAQKKARGKAWAARQKDKVKRSRVLTSVEEAKKAVSKENHDLVTMLDAPALIRKTFTQIKKESTASYALLVSQKFGQQAGKNSTAGIPKQLYPELVESISAEMTEKKRVIAERRVRRQEERERIKKEHEEQKKMWGGQPLGQGPGLGSQQNSGVMGSWIDIDEENSEGGASAGGIPGRRWPKDGEERVDVRRPGKLKRWKTEGQVGRGAESDQGQGQGTHSTASNSKGRGRGNSSKENSANANARHTPRRSNSPTSVSVSSPPPRSPSATTTTPMKRKLKKASSQPLPGQELAAHTPQPHKEFATDEKGSPLRSPSASATAYKRDVSPGRSKPSSPSRQNSQRSISSDHSPSKQVQKRELLLLQREKALLDVIYNREHAIELKNRKKEDESRKKFWMIAIAHLARVYRFKCYYKEKIQPARITRVKLAINNKQKDAALVIEYWWYYARLGLYWNKNKRQARILMSCFRRIWFLHMRVKAAKACKQIKLFLKDSAGSTMVKKLYSYRNRVSKIQQWFRDWLTIQEARTKVLWIAMEKIGARRKHENRKEANAAEQSSISNCWHNMHGFKEPMDRMNKTAKELKEVLQEREKKRFGQIAAIEQAAAAKKAANEQIDADDAETMLLRAKSMKPVSASSAMILKMQGALKDEKNIGECPASALALSKNGKAIKGGAGFIAVAQTQVVVAEKPKYPTMAQRMKTWYWITKSRVGTKKAFKALRSLLQENRKRHILAVDSLISRKSFATVSGTARQPKVSMSALKTFLLSDEASKDKDFEFFEDDDDDDETYDEGAKNDDKKNKKKKYGKKSSRPPFLLFSKGAIDFLNNVHMSYFSRR